MRKHLSFVFAACIAFSLVAAQPALGAAPTVEPAPRAVDQQFAAGEVCPFRVLLHPVEQKLFVTTYSDTLVKYWGHFVVRVTNLDSGRSVKFDNSNVVLVKTNRDTSQTIWATPPGLFYFLAGDVRSGLLKTSGPVVETLSADNVVTSFKTVGKVENLCKTLARGAHQRGDEDQNSAGDSDDGASD